LTKYCGQAAQSVPELPDPTYPRALALMAPGIRCRKGFYRWNISSKETNTRGENYHERDRGNGPGCGNGRDGASGAARAACSDKRRVLLRCSCSQSRWAGSEVNPLNESIVDPAPPSANEPTKQHPRSKPPVDRACACNGRKAGLPGGPFGVHRRFSDLLWF
jgi:hypothetical protein